MFYRWLHKTWKYLWAIVFSILLIIVILSGVVIGLLQLDVTQNYIANRIERQVENTYKADLTIDEIGGFLPFRLNMHNVVLVRTDSTLNDTVASVKQINAEVDVWELLQNKVSVSGFTVDRPRVWLRSDGEGKLKLLERRTARSGTPSNTSESWLNEFEIVAPSVSINGGEVYLASKTRKNQIGNLPQAFALTNIESSLFVDWSDEQRYLDIESFSAKTENLKMANIALSGQLYNDRRFLEFNSFYVKLGNSQFVLNGEIDGVNLLEPDFTSQLSDAHYNMSMVSEEFYLNDLGDFVVSSHEVTNPFNMEVKAEGTTDSLWVDRARVGTGESLVNFNGLLKKLRDPERFAYEIRLDQVSLQKDDVISLVDSVAMPHFRVFEDLMVSGKANGGLDSVQVDLALSSPLGSLKLQGKSLLREPYEYEGSMRGDSLDISPFFKTDIDTTSLTFDARLDGMGISLEDAVSNFNAIFDNSTVNDIRFDLLELKTSLVNGLLSQEYAYENGNEKVSGSGWIDFSREEPPLSMQGNAENMDLSQFFADLGIAQTKLNFDYNIELRGLTPNRIQGRANLDVKKSIIAGDTVRAHQFYVDLNSPDVQNRSLRLTSSLFDMNVTGQIAPGDIIDQARFWKTYLRNRYRAEIAMTAPADSQGVTAIVPPSQTVVLDGTLKAKDLSLIKSYLPSFPTIETNSQFNFNVNTDGTRLLFSAEMQADTLVYEKLKFSESRTQFTASFRSDRTFKEFSSVDFKANVASLKTEKVDLDSMGIDLKVKQDSVSFQQHVGAISNNARFRMALDSDFSDSTIAVSVKEFFLGNSEYAWTNEGTPAFTFQRNGRIDFSSFSFKNRNEYFRLQGTLSKNRSDSLTYILRDINLNRISDLIKGEVNFAGVLNGTLITRSLTRQPTIQGDLDVNRLALNDRIIGDLRFDSKYNPNTDRFDTQINIITDSTKYENYLESNDEIGQNIRLDGYFVTPTPDVKQDTVFYFDADFNQIDMWVIPLIVNNVFAEMEGQATGEGYITGNLEDFDFDAKFQTENVFARPRFINTNYFLSGPVEFGREKGVVLDSVQVLDTKGGAGTLWGRIDLNDFKPISYFDLSMDMDDLQFLNNTFDPDVPFYGNVSGSGLVRLTGSNTDLFMRTPSPIQISDDSQVSIPLLEETELEQNGKFIRFVDSFGEADKKTTTIVKSSDPESAQDELLEAIQNMTFSERFDLDLQFEARDNISVNLIFDPVTNEILTAQGTGQMRITMQDQDVQMFGQYNINDGNYQFVTGEIISRKLELEPGGTIVWEGPPDNARLNISAVYNARPNISTLLTDGAVDPQSQNGSQQAPVELIVEINGTLNSVENNYYFRLPSSLELSSNSTLQYTLNQINRDEQQKLLQATSILFTGQFIPTQGTGNATSSLSQSLTRGSNVLNPFLSNQVISPLLSNQINALLNSDVSRLDIDFNLNAYNNEIDLGIALRLYNDRLILRREGQLTGGGSQSTLSDRIGDLNATYRIRRGLSLTAFHRQDKVLNNLSTVSQVGEDVNGIGIETQLNFNTWNEVLEKIGRFFGKKKSDDSNKNDTIAEQEARKEEKK